MRQMLPPLSPDIEAALRASIERFGVIVPVLKDQHGRILDGHHRSRIADELGIEYRTEIREVHSEEEAEEIARTVNADRRQMTAKQRKEVTQVLRQEGHSFRAIGGALGVSKTQVVRDTKRAGVPDGTPAQPDGVIGQDGKSYPADRRRRLTDEQIEEARRRIGEGETQASLAREFGVAANTLSSWLSPLARERKRARQASDKSRLEAERLLQNDIKTISVKLERDAGFVTGFRMMADQERAIRAALDQRNPEQLDYLREVVHQMQTYLSLVKRCLREKQDRPRFEVV